MSSETTIVVCPGQGAQHLGMARAWIEAETSAAETFAAASKQLGFDLAEICAEGPQERLDRTDIAQAAIYVASVATLRGMAARGQYDPSTLVAAAGLSLGEYTALHLAGVFSFEQGLDLVARRGRFMQEAAEASDSGMVALIGADESQATALCTAAAGDGVLVPANFNCPGQIVISGTTDACERALQEASKAGLRATALSVAGAFHSPVMQPAADRMAEALAEADLSSPAVPVLSNVTGEPHASDADSIRKLLVEQIVQPVRWEADVRWLLANASGRWVETAPGKVLSGLMRRIDRGTKIDNHAEPK